jgi:hypothetical protein
MSSPREVGACAPSPRAAEATEETTPEAGAGAPAARRPTREATRAAEALAHAAEVTGVRRWPRRPQLRRPLSPQGRGSEAFPP